MMRNIIIIFLLIAAFFIFVSGIRPLWRETKEIKKEEAIFINFLQKIKEKRALRDELLVKYNTIQSSDLERLKKIIPASSENEIIVTQFENVAIQNNIIIQNIDLTEIATPGATQENKAYKTLSISTSVVGSYENFLSFLKEMESSLRIIDFEEISFDAGEQNIYQFNLKAKTYYLGP